MATLATRKVSAGTRLAFRIVAALLGLTAAVFTIPFAVVSFFIEDEAIHQLHNVATAIGFGVLLGGMLLVAAWRPEEQIGAFRMAIALAVGTLAAGSMSGDLVSGGGFIPPVALAVLWLLHPARSEVLRLSRPDVPLAVVSALAFVPGIAFALTQAELQRNGLATDPHWEFHHYSGMATAGISIPLAGLAASFPVRGRRLAAWAFGLGVAGTGLTSLLLSDRSGAIDPLWAWLSIAAGLAYVAVIEARRSRSA